MSLLPSGLAGSGSQEEGASLTWTGGHTTGGGESYYHAYYSGFTAIIHCMFLPLYEVSVVIDGYTHDSTLTSGDSVPLGTQIILVCRVVGLPYGTLLNYTWTCQKGDCLPKLPDGSDPYNYGRKIYNDSILAVNTTYIYYGGTYTCQVTATGREANGSFNFNITGIHMYCIIYRYIYILYTELQ